MTELEPVEVKAPGGRRVVFRVPRVRRLEALRLYRWQALDGRTGRRLPVGDAEGDRRRRLARGHARLYLATYHAGIPPTPGADPSHLETVDLDALDADADAS